MGKEFIASACHFYAMICHVKKAIAFYEELKDRFDYTLTSWLRLDPHEFEVATLTTLGASAFLFDNLFAKENAGAEITAAVFADLGSLMQTKALSEEATLLRVNMSSDLFADGQSPVRDYIRWVKETEPDVAAWEKDNYGKLAIVTIENLVNAIVARKKDQEPLRVAELLFLNLTESFAFVYKELLGPRFLSLKSAPYFENVAEAMEHIRGEIRD